MMIVDETNLLCLSNFIKKLNKVANTDLNWIIETSEMWVMFEIIETSEMWVMLFSGHSLTIIKLEWGRFFPKIEKWLTLAIKEKSVTYSDWPLKV